MILPLLKPTSTYFNLLQPTSTYFDPFQPFLFPALNYIFYYIFNFSCNFNLLKIKKVYIGGMIKRIFSLVLILSVFLQIDAQQGSPMLSNFNPLRNIENQSWAICQDDNLVMFFANRKGILTFDGDDYQTIRIPAIPYSIQKDPKDGRIYVGGDNTFGYLKKNETGGYSYLSLPGDSLPSGVVTKIIFDGPSAWFYGDQTIIRYNLDTRKQDLR